MNISFIFDRCCRSSAAVAPVTYKCDSNKAKRYFARSKILPTETLNITRKVENWYFIQIMSPQKTPHTSPFTVEQWGIFSEFFAKNIPRYMEGALYYIYPSCVDGCLSEWMWSSSTNTCWALSSIPYSLCAYKESGHWDSYIHWPLGNLDPILKMHFWSSF